MSIEAPILPPPRDRSSRRALLIWGAVLVLSGSGIGAGSALLFQKPPPPPPIQPQGEPAPGVPNFSPAPIVSQMSHELNLTSQQTEQVTTAYTQSLSAIRALRADMIVKLNSEHEKLRAAMKKTLTDQQFSEWDRHFEAVRTRFMPDAPPPWDHFHHHDRGGPGPDMRGPEGREEWMGRGMRGDGPNPPVGPEGRPEPDPNDRIPPPPGGRAFGGNDDGRPDGPGDSGGPGESPPPPAK
jgi:hypothetical protein